MGERGALVGRKAGIVAGVLTLSAATFVATAAAAIETTARPDRPASVSSGGTRADPTDGATPDDVATPDDGATPEDTATDDPSADPSEDPTDDPSADPSTDVGKPLCGPGSRCR